VLAARHGIPFYVVAPTSSIDLDTPDGTTIPIEERKAEEVLEVRGVRLAPAGTEVRNPAFDITPAELISGIVTEEGVVYAPFEAGLRDAVAGSRARRRTPPAAGQPATSPPPPASASRAD
jgi:methylthioribose-1-phosphate isomerase